MKRLLIARCIGVGLGGAVFSSGCAVSATNLTVRGGEELGYTCENGERITARYFQLDDKSLEFVKVRLPGGAEYTLPRAVAASGVRYTDEREVVWWTKGSCAFVRMRDAAGTWRIRYDNCRQDNR